MSPIRPKNLKTVKKYSPYYSGEEAERIRRRIGQKQVPIAPPPESTTLHPSIHVSSEIPQVTPSWLARYECIRSIGKGSFGEVVVIRRKPLSRPPTLFAAKISRKMLHRRYEKMSINAIRTKQNTAQRKDDKNVERRILASLPWSPFIAGIVNAFDDSRNLYQVLELGIHGTLHQYIHHRSLSPEHCRFYFINIALALEFLHSHGIIHRDLKPENIVMGADGYLMLTDFGNSQRVDSDNLWDEMGTLHYVAPECILNTVRKECVTATDWWSAACILFEMAAGKLAFPLRRANNDVEALTNCRTQIKNVAYRWPRRTAFHPDLRDLVDRMLVLEVEKRIASVTDDTGMNTQLRSHSFFQESDWKDIKEQRILAPYVPPSGCDPTQEWLENGVPWPEEAPGFTIVKPPIGQTYDIRTTYKNFAPERQAHLFPEPELFYY
ncbi:unnamed protein product [Somion occarium]|uniref:non-specific serine/threonine protein kinase n=1 Tax=Somion occarium TaxID=3059160 RepID=A0ABP1DCK6_9APHY